MYPMREVFRHFFTHKDFLPPPKQWPGTLFTPLQICFCLAVAVLIGFACVYVAKKPEKTQKKVFFVLWLLMFLSEPLIAWWDAAAGRGFFVDWTSTLSLWPCSIFLYAAPFALFGKGWVKEGACGYICTLGLVGGLVNFVYPATYLAYYSCFSLAGLRTVFYHGAMVFTAVTMLLSGYHSFKIQRWQQLLYPALPMLAVSFFAGAANHLIPGADYMFFRLNSFFFAPLGRALPPWGAIALVYLLYLILHIAPYLPSHLRNVKVKRALREKE